MESKACKFSTRVERQKRRKKGLADLYSRETAGGINFNLNRLFYKAQKAGFLNGAFKFR